MNRLLDKINNFKRLKIKNLVLGSDYTPKSNIARIKKNTTGVDVTVSQLNKIKNIIKEEEILTYHQYFRDFADTLNIQHGTPVRWDLILDRKSCSKYVSYLKESLTGSEALLTSYNTEIFEKRCSVYEGLGQVKLDEKLLEIPKYSHSSVTGRTGITAGTNFMTMKKVDREKLKPANDDDHLVEIDVKSCEPSLYLKYLGLIGNDMSDVYAFIKKTLNLADIPRDKFKRGVLSILYGASERTSKNILKCTHSDITKIRNFFMIEELTSTSVASSPSF